MEFLYCNWTFLPKKSVG